MAKFIVTIDGYSADLDRGDLLVRFLRSDALAEGLEGAIPPTERLRASL